MTIDKRDDVLRRAIAASGGTAALCRFINENSPEDRRLTTQAISQWKRCPDGRVLILERAQKHASGHIEVPRHELRPDLYPESESAAGTEQKAAV